MLALLIGLSFAKPPVTPELELFDAVTKRVGETFPEADYNGVSWEADVKAARKKVAKSKDPGAAVQVLQDLLDSLGSSHLTLHTSGPPPVNLTAWQSELASTRISAPFRDPNVWNLRTGLSVAWHDGAWMPLWVEDDLKIHGIRYETRLSEFRGVPARLDFGPLKESLGISEVTVETVRDRYVEDLTACEGNWEVVFEGSDQPSILPCTVPGTFTSLTVMESQGHHDTTVTVARRNDFGIVRIPLFAPNTYNDFRTAMVGLRAAGMRHLVIDLRHNLGGLASAAQAIAGLLISPEQSLGTYQYRGFATPVNVTRSAPGERFDGPVTILVDGQSCSSSELLASSLQDIGRATVVGEPSCGALMLSLVEAMPNGAVLQFPIASYKTPSGTVVEGQRATPDKPFPALPTNELLDFVIRSTP